MIRFTGYREKLQKLREFATVRSLSMVELAIAWLLSEPVVASVIVGATSAEQVAQNAAAAGKTVNSIGQDRIGPACSGEVRPWRTNLSKIGEVSRKVLLPLLGAVRLRKWFPSGFRFPFGNISRADYLDLCTSAAYA